ncbi:hypothetical protein RQP46_006414 [Phenoliferia psychrophenolica]
MLFDTPGVSVPDSVMAAPSNGSAKRKRKSSDDAPAPPSPAVNLDKLMKQMQKLEKDSGWGGGLGAGGKTGVKAAEKVAQGKQKKEQKKKNKAAAPPPFSGGNAAGLGQVDPPAPAAAPAPTKADQGHRGPPPRAAPQPQSRPPPPAAAPSNPGSPAPAPAPAPAKVPVAAWKPAKKEKPSKNKERAVAAAADAALDAATEPKKVVRHSAPTTEANEEEDATPSIPQTAMQKSLRAKLAGGKFRLLNEALYTSTGEEAWTTMKEEGAFDDYHAGFRSQAAHWPTQPLTLLTTSLSSREQGTFIADFGCGDAALARALVPQGLNVISFDLVSKDGWVIEAECSSVPLPGGTAGSEIVDVVVCCLSLMGTDWIQVVREAKRVLKDGGELRIAEVTSRFTDVDAFVALITAVGFKLDQKDATNTHFMMFDFTKTGESEDRKSKAEGTRKAPGLLKPRPTSPRPRERNHDEPPHSPTASHRDASGSASALADLNHIFERALDEAVLSSEDLTTDEIASIVRESGEVGSGWSSPITPAPLHMQHEDQPYANASRSPTRARSFSPDSVGSSGRATSPESSTSFSIGTPSSSPPGPSPFKPFNQNLADALESEALKKPSGAFSLGFGPLAGLAVNTNITTTIPFPSIATPSDIPSIPSSASMEALGDRRRQSFISLADVINEERMGELTGTRDWDTHGVVVPASSRTVSGALDLGAVADALPAAQP